MEALATNRIDAPACQGVYLIHFDTPYKQARHYLGYSDNIAERLECHRRGQGARLMEVIKENGIGWCLARIWKGASRRDERKLKNQKNAPLLCPICRARIGKDKNNG